MNDNDAPLLPLVEAESIDWLNQFVAKLWPKIDLAAQKIVQEKVLPSIQEAVPSQAKGIHFKEFTLGKKPLQLGPMKIYDLKEKGMMLRMGIQFLSDTDIEIELGFANVGVKNLAMTGEITLRFTQLIDETPIVGGIVAYFLDPPRISFDFTGLGSVVSHIPGLTNIIRNAVDSAVCSKLVLPNQIAVCLGEEGQGKREGFDGIDLAKIKCPSPHGLLKMVPQYAKGLKGSDWHLLGKATSDPYCIVKMSDETLKTSVVKKTCDPHWDPSKDSGYFLFYDRAQNISLEVWDYDFGNADDSLGYSQPMKAAIALNDPKILDPGIALYPKPCKPGMDPEGEMCGRVSLNVEYFEIDFENAAGTLGDSEMCLVAVKLDKLKLPKTSVDKQAKVNVKVKNGDYELCKTSPVGTMPPGKGVSKSIEKALDGVVKRCSAKNMDVNDIAELVELPVEDVEAIVKGGSASQVVKSSQLVDIEVTLHFAVQRFKLTDSAQVELNVLDAKDKTIASAVVSVASVLQAEKLRLSQCKEEGTKRLICKGDKGDVPLDVVISIHPTKSVKSKSRSSAPSDWHTVREKYFGECSPEVESYYDDAWAKNQGNWAISQSTGGKNNDFMEHHFYGKAKLLKLEKSVKAAVDRLNTEEGHKACPEGYCVVYSESKKLNFLIFRKDKLRKAHELFPDMFELKG